MNNPLRFTFIEKFERSVNGKFDKILSCLQKAIPEAERRQDTETQDEIDCERQRELSETQDEIEEQPRQRELSETQDKIEEQPRQRELWEDEIVEISSNEDSPRVTKAEIKTRRKRISVSNNQRKREGTDRYRAGNFERRQSDAQSSARLSKTDV